MRRALALLVCCLVFVPHAATADEHEAFVKEHLDGLSGAKALELVKELAADGMKGRKTAFEGGSLVEEWMLAKMSEFGLHPADAAGTYLEPFTYGAANTVAPIALTVGGKALVYGTDFFDLTYTGSGKVEAEAVFVGYGIERPDVGWDDYAGMDVKGKVVVAIRGAPAAMADTFREERYIGYKSSKAAEKGAAGFLLVQDDKASTGTIQDRFHQPKLPALWVSGAVADTLFAAKKTTLAALKKSRDEGDPGKGFATGVRVAMEVNATYKKDAKGHNALGAIKGRDPDLVHEIILVGAHMDHLGVGPDGQVFNGADDNASGTAVLIHLADVLTGNRLRPKRTIIFCGFGAEEQGLFGSRALAARYPFQGEVVAVLNMDMVGQGEPVVRVNGGGFFPRIQALLDESIPAGTKDKVDFGPYTGGGSDHAPFVERGVPAFAISTKGEHPNYHTPLDDAAAIDPACLEATAEVVGRMLLKLAMHPESLHDDKAMASFLLREGPRYGYGGYLGQDTREPALIDVSRRSIAKLDDADVRGYVASGLSGAIWRVEADERGRAEWAALVERAGKDDSALAIVRDSRQMVRAWRQRTFGLLPFLSCTGSIDERKAQLAEAAADGVTLVAPWAGMAPEAVDEACVRALCAACVEHRVVPDLRGMSQEQWGVARKALAAHPAVLMAPVAFLGQTASKHDTLPEDTLVLLQGDLGAVLAGITDAAKPMLPVHVMGSQEAPAADALLAWSVTQPAGWALPDAPQRGAIRAALGGNLLRWLAKAERLRR